MSDDTDDNPSIWFWIKHGAFALILLLFLAIMMAAEWTRLGWWRLRRLAGKTDKGPPPRVWTAPVQPRKPGW